MPVGYTFREEDEEPLPFLEPAEPLTGAVEVPEDPEVLPTPSPPHPGFWWAVLWCLGILVVTQFVPGMIGIIIFLIASAGRLKPEVLTDSQALANSPEYIQAMMPAMMLSQILSAALAWLAIRLVVGKGWPRILALRWPSWSHLLLALLGLPGLILIATGVDGLAKEVLPSLFDLEQTMGMFGKWPWQVGVLVIGLGPGIGEELWFRGFLGRGLVGRYGVIVGVLLTSLLFGLFHVEPRQIAYATVIGILLHLSYLATRSFLVPVMLHITNNSLGILAMHSPELRAIDMPAGQIPWYVYGASILLLAAVGWAFFRSRPLHADTPGSDALPWRPAFAGVEYPPRNSATRVRHRAPDATAWFLVAVSVVAFAVAAVPVVVEASEKASEEREKSQALVTLQAQQKMVSAKRTLPAVANPGGNTL